MLTARRAFAGGTAFHLAAIGGHPEVIRALLAAGGDHTLANAARHTPLEAAIAHYENGAIERHDLVSPCENVSLWSSSPVGNLLLFPVPFTDVLVLCKINDAIAFKATEEELRLIIELLKGVEDRIPAGRPVRSTPEAA